MTRSAVGNRFRTRKLSTKQNLAVLRENQIDSVDDDAQRNIPQIETGVERQEETEHHLQAAISASHAVAVGVKDSQKIFIPTPNTLEITAINYEKLYPTRFKEPSSYIRFSSTVEECSGAVYCISEADDKFLAKLNQTKRPPITEDEFESIMDLYESTIQIRQPFLSMDVSNILPYEELESAFDENLNPTLKPLAKLLYSHWKEQKMTRGGKSIVPVLKFEQGNEKDEGDPYVCFRRREVRQVRKTRRTDAQSTDKLKRIRQELETARGLVKDVLQRETMRKQMFEYEYRIFEKRRTIIELKRRLGIKGDDEDLINKPKRPKSEQGIQPVPRPRPQNQQDADLKQLSQLQAEDVRKQQERFNQLKAARLRPKYPLTDITEECLFPSTDMGVNPVGDFSAVETFYLPSPPPSSGSASPSPDASDSVFKSPSVLQTSPRSRRLPAYRRRIGRGGRTLLDRRGTPTPFKADADPILLDRIKFDSNDNDRDVQCPVFSLDPYSIEHILFRAQLLSPPPEMNPWMPQQRRPPMINSTPPIVQKSQMQPLATGTPQTLPSSTAPSNSINGHLSNSFSA